MTRKTFDQATRDVIADSRLGAIVSGEVPITPNNWKAAAEQTTADVNKIVDNLCKDMSLLIGRNVVRKSQFYYPEWIVNNNRIRPKDMAKFVWDKILNLYPRWLNNSVANLVVADKAEPITFPLHALKWVKSEVKTVFPDTTGALVDICLKEPEESHEGWPVHFRHKLDLLQETYYDYQPYVLKDAAGPDMLLCLRLGCQWKDLVIASHRHPENKIADASLAAFGLLSWAIAGLILYLSPDFLGWVFGGFFGIIGCLLSALLAQKQTKSLKV